MASWVCSAVNNCRRLCLAWNQHTDMSATAFASLSPDTLVAHRGKACSTKALTAASSGSSSIGLFLLLGLLLSMRHDEGLVCCASKNSVGSDCQHQ